MIRKTNQTGQIALIALLVLMIATTVGLSLVARTTTDVSVTRTIEESTRAFSAAEAGIEESLQSRVDSAGTIDPALGISYIATVSAFHANADTPFIFPQKTLKGNTETVWLVNHSDENTIVETPTYTADYIDVCWSSELPTPALIVSVLYKTGGVYQIAKSAFDPDRTRATDPVTGNNFSALSGPTGCPNTTTYGTRIRFLNFIPSINPVADTLIALRIRPVYSGTQLAIAPAQDLPYQENQIQSVGMTASGVTRKIIVYQQYRSPASVFDYVLYSEGSL